MSNKIDIQKHIRDLGDEHWKVRDAAVKFLGQLGNRRAVEPLIRTLGDEKVRVRWATAKSLGQLGDLRAVEPIICALGDEKVSVRRAAAKSLGQLGDPRAVESLLRILGDKDRYMRRASTQAIRTICENNQHLLGSSWVGCVCSEHLNRFIHRRVSLSFFEKTSFNFTFSWFIQNFDRFLSKITPYPVRLANVNHHIWRLIKKGEGHETSYYACRTCRADQPRYEAVSDVILVLDDRATNPSPIQQENILYVPWNLARGIFDFNAVEIQAANSSNIERFLVQFEEDTDPARPWKQESAGKLSCRVLPGCAISPADRARLQRHFEIEIIDGNS